MKNTLIAFLLLIPCCIIAQDDTQARKDSLRNRISATEGAEKLESYWLLTNIYFMESTGDDLKMDTLLALYREYDAEAVRQGNLKTQGLIMNNTISAYRNRSELDEILKLTPDYLAFLAKHELWLYYYSIYMTKLRAYLESGEYAKAIEETNKMYNEAKLRNHDNGKGMALYTLFLAYSSMNRFDEAEKYLKESINILKNDNELLAITAMAYSRLCDLVIDRYDEVLPLLREFEKINYRYEEFSKAKQPTTWVNLWNNYMNFYFINNDYDTAEIYCNKLDSMNVGTLLKEQVYRMRAKIYYERKQYDKALEMADKAAELNNVDPVTVNSIMELKIMILSAQRGVSDLYDLFQQSANLRDSIRDTDFNSHLDELRTVYEVDKITAEKERNRNYFLFALGVCVLLTIALGIWIYYNRIIVRKNKALYRQIKEQDRLAKELKQITTGESSENLPGDRPQRQLVANFSNYLLNERNFAKPEISLDDMISELATNRTYLYEAVKAVTKKTPLEYIHYLKLEEAKQMLETRFDINIEMIAEGCGFNSRSTFYRLFREYYQISPTDFRKIAKKQANK